MEARVFIPHTIPANGTRGSFHLRAGGEFITLQSIRDLSVSGTGISIRKQLRRGVPVSLTYTARGCHIELSGHVVWCEFDGLASETQTRTYRAGIRFDSIDPDSYQLMFLALRAYLDPFPRTRG